MPGGGNARSHARSTACPYDVAVYRALLAAAAAELCRILVPSGGREMGAISPACSTRPSSPGSGDGP
jgi:hypothetical protein